MQSGGAPVASCARSTTRKTESAQCRGSLGAAEDGDCTLARSLSLVYFSPYTASLLPVQSCTAMASFSADGDDASRLEHDEHGVASTTATASAAPASGQPPPVQEQQQQQQQQQQQPSSDQSWEWVDLGESIDIPWTPFTAGWLAGSARPFACQGCIRGLGVELELEKGGNGHMHIDCADPPPASVPQT